MIATIIGALAAAIWAYLIVFRGGFWRIAAPYAAAAASAAPPPSSPRSVVAVIPARDEADVIGQTVSSLLAQDYPRDLFRIILVDDHSSDGTAGAARAAAAAAGSTDRLTIVTAPTMPPGWSGKLWAVRQGVAAAAENGPPDYLLLTDADIVHPRGNLAELVARAEAGRFALVSLMVELHCRTAWERLLIPAFVFFFFKLFPPRQVADSRSRTAGAAGGCMLARRGALERAGGIDSIRHEIIDDCALAGRIKRSGGAVWLGPALPTATGGTARSIREYGGWRPIWGMIARCAFAQLGYSAPALVATIVLMLLIYVAPPLLTLFGPLPARFLGAAAWAAMSLIYLPMLRLYRCPWALAPLLPLAALFYTAATVASAIQFWRGRGGNWKGRFQAVRPGEP